MWVLTLWRRCKLGVTPHWKPICLIVIDYCPDQVRCSRSINKGVYHNNRTTLCAVLLIDIVQIVNDYIGSPLAKRVNAYYKNIRGTYIDVSRVQNHTKAGCSRKRCAFVCTQDRIRKKERSKRKDRSQMYKTTRTRL